MHWSTQITHEWIERRTPTYTYGDIRRPSVRPRPRVLCRIDITVRSYAQYLSGPIFDEDSDSQLHFGSFCHPGAVFRRFHLTFIHTVCAIGNRIAQPTNNVCICSPSCCLSPPTQTLADYAF